MDGSAEGRFSIRAIFKEGSTSLQTLSVIASALRVSLVDVNAPSPPPAPLPCGLESPTGSLLVVS
jgi:hypothetical protein